MRCSLCRGELPDTPIRCKKCGSKICNDCFDRIQPRKRNKVSAWPDSYLSSRIESVCPNCKEETPWEIIL